MKKIILAVFSIVILLVIGLLVGPSFIDWNKYKAQIITQAEAQSGYNIDITGDLSLALLPSPKLKIEGLIIEAPTKVKYENLLQIKTAEVSVQLAPLLRKNIAVDKVTLIDPIVNVELFEDGQGSWMTAKMKAAQNIVKMTGEQGGRMAKQAAGNMMDSIAVNRLDIENGMLSFYDHKSEGAHIVKDMNITLNARTLKGPYRLRGNLNANGKKIETNLKVGAFDPNVDSLSLNGDVTLTTDKITLHYDGLVATKAPYEAQGQIKVALDNGIANVLDKKASIEGLLTAGEDKIEMNDLIAYVGQARANGKLSVSNLKQKTPINVFADLKFNQAIDLGDFQQQTRQKSSASGLSASTSTSAQGKDTFVPSSSTLPMAIDANITMDVPAVIIDNKKFEGLFLSAVKKETKTSVTAKIINMPGQGKVEGRADISFASSSVSPKSGAVTYSDPSVTFEADGNIGQLDKTLAAFAPQIDKNTAALFKTAQFDLKGSVSPASISLKDSVVKLDQTTVGIGGRYTPLTNGEPDKAVIDLSVGSIDLDRLMGGDKKTAQAPSQSASSSVSGPAPSGGLKEALKPFQEFSLPVDLVFDVSVQKARVNGTDIKGLRLTGESAGDKLAFKTASINDYQGAALNVAGTVANRSTLSGLDLALGLKTSDVQGFVKAMKIDTTKLPKTLNSVDANVALKGSVERLDTDLKVKAMGGQLDVSGLVSDALGTPQMSNMRIGLKHPNLSQAIKVVSPDFKSNKGLAQAINISTNATTQGEVIALSDIKATLGTTSFAGDINIDQSASVPSVNGKIQAGTIALDQLLGAKNAQKKSASSSGASSSASSSNERWSKTPINVDWMNSLHVDLDLSANAIKYDAWLFEKPSTTLKVQNGTLTVTNLKAGVFGGQATLNTSVKAPAQAGGALNFTMDSAMNGVSLETLAYALSKSKKLQSAGTVSFNFDVNAKGLSADALINALNGKAALDGQNIVLKGFDLAKMARGLAVEDKLADSVTSLLRGSLSGGQTAFDTIKGDYKIENGVVRINSMSMDGDAARIDSTGYTSLSEWKINTDHIITLKNVPDLEPFEVKIKGPLDNPANTFGKNILEDYLQDKIKRKLAKELPDVLGDDVTDKLKKFGILPQQQKAPSPSYDNVAPSPQPEKTAPKKIEKPEDALKELLNSDNPEDAVGNVLRGLF